MKISRFTGMDTYKGGVSEGIAVPDRIVNAVADLDGILLCRQGSELKVPLSECSNLYHNKETGRTYCVSDGWFCLVDVVSGALTQLEAVSGFAGRKIYYAMAGNVMYAGNEWWMVADEGGTVRQVGQSIDDLQAMNWESSDNGLVLYLKNSDGSSTVVPHPAEFAHSPDPLNGICIGHGCMWGFRGRKVFYSCEMMYEWWEDQKNFFEYADNVTMVALTQAGVYVGTETDTLFLSGTSPEKMSEVSGNFFGVKRDSLVFASNIQDMPNDTPVWMGVNGVVYAGMPDGQVIPVTNEVIEVTPADDCRAGVVKLNGVDTLLFKIED